MRKFILLPVIVLAFSCSSISVSYDFDKTTDFSKFKSYAFTTEALQLPIQELNRNRLIAAVEKELNKRGMSKSDNPDVMIDLIVRAEKKQEATAYNTGTGMYGRGYRYGGGFSTTQINVNEYIEGTLFINVVSNNSLVWSGRGTKTIDEELSPEKREQNINYAVSEIFKKYPIQPGK